MNDDFTNLESELRALRPRQSGARMEEQISAILDQSAPRLLHAPWWEWFGFNRPLAAVGWGLVSPTLTVALVIAATRFAQTSHSPAPLPTAEDHPILQRDMMARTTVAENAKATNVVYQAQDEGIVLDAGREPVHRLRYRSADFLRWRNPNSGAQWEISYPREDVLLVPVQAD